MKLKSLRTRGVPSGAQDSIALALALGLSLSACGPQNSSEISTLHEEPTTAQSYQEWCTDWQLDCPVPDPSKTNPITASQFKAFSTIAGSALSSPSKISITRQELDANTLKQALTALHLDDVYQDLITRLDASQWQSGGLENGAVVSRHAASSSLRTDAGLIWNVDAQQTVSVIPGTVQLSGLGLSSDAAKEAAQLQGLQASDDGSFNFGLNDRSVQQVPQDFALDQVLLAFGLDMTKLEGKDLELPDIIAAGAPLVNWLNQSSRQIVLERSFFATAANEMPILLPEDGMGAALGNLMSRLEKLQTSSASGSNLASVALVRGSSAKCDMNNGEIKVKFSAEFGVKRIYQPSAGSLGIEFYGVEASAKKALGIGIKLKRVELSADKITILDVPIIGKVDLKLDDVSNPDQPTTLACGA